GMDQTVFECLALRLGQPFNQTGQVVSGGEAVPDEQHLHRPAAACLLCHVPLSPGGCRRVGYRERVMADRGSRTPHAGFRTRTSGWSLTVSVTALTRSCFRTTSVPTVGSYTRTSG